MKGSHIQALRRYHGLTQADVARAIGVSEAEVSVVEREEQRADDARRRRVAEGILRATSPARILRRHEADIRRYLAEEKIEPVSISVRPEDEPDRWDAGIEIRGVMPSGGTSFDVLRWQRHLAAIAGGVTVRLTLDPFVPVAQRPRPADDSGAVHAGRSRGSGATPGRRRAGQDQSDDSRQAIREK